MQVPSHSRKVLVAAAIRQVTNKEEKTHLATNINFCNNMYTVIVVLHDFWNGSITTVELCTLLIFLV